MFSARERFNEANQQPFIRYLTEARAKRAKWIIMLTMRLFKPRPQPLRGQTPPLSIFWPATSG